ncbi:MAG: hypothetical protein IJS88_01345 [Alphaproteobacteria bacterium]|nr:hypothetical protein [Alphaproteobacteria bacterium]
MEKKIDVTLSGVVNCGLKSIGEKLSTFKMFVTGAVMHNHNDAKWQFPLPTLISIHLRDCKDMTMEDMYALLTVGTEVNVRVTGEPGHIEAKVVKVEGRTRRTLENFVLALENCAPNVGPGIRLNINGDMNNQGLK